MIIILNLKPCWNKANRNGLYSHLWFPMLPNLDKPNWKFKMPTFCQKHIPQKNHSNYTVLSSSLRLFVELSVPKLCIDLKRHFQLFLWCCFYSVCRSSSFQGAVTRAVRFLSPLFPLFLTHPAGHTFYLFISISKWNMLVDMPLTDVKNLSCSPFYPQPHREVFLCLAHVVWFSHLLDRVQL